MSTTNQFNFTILYDNTSTPLTQSSESTVLELKDIISQALQIPFNNFSIYLEQYGQIDNADLLYLPLNILSLPENKNIFLFIYDKTKQQSFASLFCSFRILGCKPSCQIGYKLLTNNTVICLSCAKYCRNNEIDKNKRIIDEHFICKCSLLNDNKCKFCALNQENINEYKQLQLITHKTLLDIHSDFLLQFNKKKKEYELAKIRNRIFDFERSITYGLQRVNRYDNVELKNKALSLIPLKPSEMNTHDYVKLLLKWFKNDFFCWCNQPKCPTCGQIAKQYIKQDKPTEYEKKYLCSRAEVYNCKQCNKEVRFPRYNDPYILLETRTGRCGEYANTFGCVLNAVGLKVRFVDNFEDHVWNEFYSDIEHRWIHVDSCEGAFDKPLLYEQGWGRVMTFILAHSKEGCYDVTPRYIKNWETCKERRSSENEKELNELLEGTNLSIQVNYNETRLNEIKQRELEEKNELDKRKGTEDLEVSKEETICRQSGSVEWRKERGELK